MNRKRLKEAARQCIAEAQGPVKKTALCWLLSVAAIILLNFASSELSVSSGSGYISDTISSTVTTYVTTYGIALILQLLLTLLEAGLVIFGLRLSRNEEFSCGVLLEGFHDFLRVICYYILKNIYISLWSIPLGILMGLALSPVIVSSGGTIPSWAYALVSICSVLAVFLISYRYRGGFFALMDDPSLSASGALKHATAINKPYRGRLFLLDLSFIPTLLLCVLTCGVLLVWKLPYITATYAHAYHQMNLGYQQRQDNLKPFYWPRTPKE